jgi:hypothetical protein
MQQSALYGARALPPPVRSVLEELLGRALDDSETISIRAYQPHESPSLEQQQALACDLRRHLAEVDEKSKDVPESEQDEIIDEAIRSVRPGYRPKR